MIKEAISMAVRKENISGASAEAVIDEMMRGEASHIHMSAFLAAMAAKGETVDEIAGAASAMRRHCVKLPCEMDVLEIVGTGGDRSNSFNISTTAAFVVSAAGIPVAKHGNRAASSKCGAADVLEALGADISLPPDRSRRMLESIGLCFMFAQTYHSAMKHVAPVRKELGIRTLFNLLGPLSNPAAASMQLLGVYDAALVEPMARVLYKLGVKSAMVVYGQDGLDEISLCAPTNVCELRGGEFSSYVIEPEDFGFRRCEKHDLVGGDPAENAGITRAILSGERGPRRDTVVLNSAAAIHIAKEGVSIEEAITIAERTIDSGMALRQLELFVKLSKGGKDSVLG